MVAGLAIYKPFRFALIDQGFDRDKRSLDTYAIEGELAHKRVVIQGFGNVGYHAAKFLSQEDGCKVTRVIEYNGVITDDAGLNIEELKAHFTKNGTFENFDQGVFSSPQSKDLTKDCDILIPAALENTITPDIAQNLSASLIVEAANGPIGSQADEILKMRRIAILPDLFVNSGGVIVSYFEWVKNLTHIPFGLMERRQRERGRVTIAACLERMTGQDLPEDLKGELLHGASEIDLVRSGLDDVIRSAYEKMSVIFHHREDISDFRTAAYVIAISEIANAYQVIGI